MSEIPTIDDRAMRRLDQEAKSTYPTPSVGRIVHYVSYGTPGGEYTSQCRAAVIAGLPDGDLNSAYVMADLVVFNPTGLFFNRCPQDEVNAAKGGTWHWPERV